MTTIPSPEAIIDILDKIDEVPADSLESQVLDFKRWTDAKKSLAEAVKMAVCFANSEGGLVVFGVKDKVRGRTSAVTGCNRYDLDIWRRDIYERTVPNLTVDVSELEVTEGKLILVRVPKGPTPPYGTSAGLYQVRVGKNCMPYSPNDFQRRQVSIGAIDWSAQEAEGIDFNDLSPTEISRLRDVVRANRSESPLVKLSDHDLLSALGIVKEGRITRAGILLVGRKDAIHQISPEHEVIYLHHTSPTDLDFRLDQKGPLLQTLDKLTDAINIRNPFKTLKTGIFHTDIPAFPEITFREAILNAIIHRNYQEHGSVYIRHKDKEMSISSPGGFIGGINADNLLHAEPRARNRLLAEIFQKLGLVERAGMGIRRIFIPSLAHGKRAPVYDATEHTVKLTIFNDNFDHKLASFVSSRGRQGEPFDITELLLISYLRRHETIDIVTAASLTQLPQNRIKTHLEDLCSAATAWLTKHENKGATFFKIKPSAIIESSANSTADKKTEIEKSQWSSLIQQYVTKHGSISNSECRELLALGQNASAQTTVSRLLTKLNFLEPYGPSPKKRRYRLRKEN